MKVFNISFTLILCISFLLSGCAINSMIDGYHNNFTYNVKNNPLEYHGNEVNVEFNGRVNKKYFKPGVILELTPTLSFANKELPLKTIILRGERTSGEGHITNFGSPNNFHFAEVVPYEEGMKDMELIIKGKIFKQGKEDNKKLLPNSQPIALGTIVTPLTLEKDEDVIFIKEKENNKYDFVITKANETLKNGDEKIFNYLKRIKESPNDYISLNNLACLYIGLGDLINAKYFMEKAYGINPNNGYILNNFGVIYAWSGEYQKSKNFYEKSKNNGLRSNYNIGNLMIVNGDYIAAVSSYAGRTCTYNVALAYMLNDNLTAAKSNIECARKNAKNYYLAAIIEARRDNETLMYENLNKAIEQDVSYKKKAKSDLEFYKFQNSKEFKIIIK